MSGARLSEVAVSIPSMTDPSFPESLVVLQRAVTAAWAEVEAHRKAVDGERRTGAVVESDPTRRWESPALRPWTAEEDAEHERLLAAVTVAAQALREGIRDAGLDGGYAVTQGLHKAARA